MATKHTPVPFWTSNLSGNANLAENVSSLSRQIMTFKAQQSVFRRNWKEEKGVRLVHQKAFPKFLGKFGKIFSKINKTRL